MAIGYSEGWGQAGLAFQMDFKHVDRFGDTDESDLFSQVFQQMTMGH